MGGTWKAVINENFLFVEQMVLDHVVRDLKGQHGILDRIELIDVDDPKQYELSSVSNLNFKSTLLKIGRLVQPRKHNLRIEAILCET